MIKEEARAKLNLNLLLNSDKLPNGFYPVNFINCQLDLHDELTFEPVENRIEIICNNPQVPQKEDNLIYKAAILLKEIINKDNLGVRITLQKNIPVKAGFGGGSSDTAVALKVLSKLWQVDLSSEQLLNLAGKLGKDVYYFLKGGLCEIKGDGSQVTILPLTLPVFYLLIVVPKIQKPSTAWMYQHLDPAKIGKNLVKFAKLKKAIKQKNKEKILSNLFNDFEALALSSFPELVKIKQDLTKCGVQNSLLAGSGLSLVGFFTSEDRALSAKNKLINIYPDIIYAKTK